MQTAASTSDHRNADPAPLRLFDPEIQRDPYPAYRTLRERFPVYREPQLETWLLTRWEDVRWAMRAHDTFSNASGVFPPTLAAPGKPDSVPPPESTSRRLPLVFEDPPQHELHRKLVEQAFTPRRIDALAPFIREVADQLLDASEGKTVDAAGGLAVPLPGIVIGEMLGVPREEHAQFQKWTTSILVESGDPDLAARSIIGLRERFAALFRERRQRPANDLISALLEARLGDEVLDEEMLISFCQVLVNAGHETTTNLIGNLLNVIAGDPALWSALQRDRSLVKLAVEESLRYDSPTQMLWKTASHEVVRHGVTIPEGGCVGMVFASANRDPERFPDPDTFRLDRDARQRQHVAFGYGIHFCLGAALARTEAQLVTEALLDRYAAIEHDDEPAERVHSSVLRGFRRLPLRFRH